MTRQEAIAYIYEWLKDEYALNYKDKEALKKAIKALEQEPVLDKIRAEIEQEQDDFMDDKDYDDGVRFGLMQAYQIIDKYRGEDFNE